MNGNIKFYVSSMGILSYAKAFREIVTESKEIPVVNPNGTVISYEIQNTTFRRTFPVHSLVVSVDHGVVKSLSWDNLCRWCPTQRCGPDELREGTPIQVQQSHHPARRVGNNCYEDDTQCKSIDGTSDGSEDCQFRVSLE